jgi:hypothetical protein
VQPDVSQGCCTKQGITDGMKQNIGIAVAVKSIMSGDVNASDHKLSALCKRVYIDTNSNTHGKRGLIGLKMQATKIE